MKNEDMNISEQKLTMIQARVSDKLANDFKYACKLQNKSVSDTLRELICQFTNANSFFDKKIEIDVNVGDPYGRGKHDKDEFAIVATVKGAALELISDEINFLIPEFPNKPFQIDSFYYHRAIFPGARNVNGRLLGAQLKKSSNKNSLEWKGALFLYGEMLSDKIKKIVENEIKEQIILGMNNYFSEIKETYKIKNDDEIESLYRFEYPYCIICIKKQKDYDYGAWRLTVKLISNLKSLYSLELNNLEQPVVDKRFIIFDNKYRCVKYNNKKDEFYFGFKTVNGIVEADVYSNGIAEENNPHPLKMVSDEFNRIIEEKINLTKSNA